MGFGIRASWASLKLAQHSALLDLRRECVLPRHKPLVLMWAEGNCELHAMSVSQHCRRSC